MKRCLYGGTLSLPPDLGRFFNDRGIELVRNPLGRPLKEPDLLQLLGNFDAVLAGPEPYTEKVLASASVLKIIARTGVGYDQVDVGAATRHGVFVTWTPIPELSSAIAELAIGHILAFIKQIPQLNAAVRQGQWDRQRWSEEIDDAYHLTLGLLGAGRIGIEVAKRATAFGMKVIYHDVVRIPQLEDAVGATYLTLDELLSQADVLSIHVPLNANTEGLINEKQIEKMKRSAIIINTARGKVIDERALSKALIDKRIAGACLDALSDEPPMEWSPFYRLGDKIPNLVITPHVGIGRFTFAKMVMTAAEDVATVLDGRDPAYPVNKELVGHRKSD